MNMIRKAATSGTYFHQGIKLFCTFIPFTLSNICYTYSTNRSLSKRMTVFKPNLREKTFRANCYNKWQGETYPWWVAHFLISFVLT
jgi:hypothetical protein